LQSKGLSSSLIVTVAVSGEPIWAPHKGLAKLTIKVSSESNKSSAQLGQIAQLTWD
jgi:hypothetical protein